MVAMAFDKFLIYLIFLKHVYQHEFPCIESLVKGENSKIGIGIILEYKEL